MSRHEHLLDQLFTYGGLEEEAAAWMTYSFAILRQKYPRLTTEQLSHIFSDYGTQYYLKRLRFVYSQQFSDAELEQIAKFWASEAGTKLVRGPFREAQKRLATEWAGEVEEVCRRRVLEGEGNANEQP